MAGSSSGTGGVLRMLFPDCLRERFDFSGLWREGFDILAERFNLGSPVAVNPGKFGKGSSMITVVDREQFKIDPFTIDSHCGKS